jgi:hypothetical protein
MPRHLSRILQRCVVAALGMLMAVRRRESSVECRLRWFAGEREGRGSSATLKTIYTALGSTKLSKTSHLLLGGSCRRP